jgi:hypothetical protein
MHAAAPLFDALRRFVERDQAAPGIPPVMPGERHDDDVIALLSALRDAGNPISASDPTLEVVLAVR